MVQIKYKFPGVEKKWRTFTNIDEYNNFCDYYDEKYFNKWTLLEIIVSE